MSENKLMSTAEVARAIGLSENGVRDLDARGVLRPAFRTLRGRRLYRPTDVERMRQKRESEKRAA